MRSNLKFWGFTGNFAVRAGLRLLVVSAALSWAINCGGSGSSTSPLTGTDGGKDTAITDADPTYDGSPNMGACTVAQRTTVTKATGTFAAPSIVWNGAAYLVTWSDARLGPASIWMTFLNPDGTRQASSQDTLVAQTAAEAISPSASPLGDGRYLLVWENCTPSAPDCAGGTSVGKLVFDTSGAPVGPASELTAVAAVQRRPHVVSDFSSAYATFRDVQEGTIVSRVLQLDPNGNVVGDITLGAGTGAQYPFIATGNGQVAVIYRRGQATADIVLATFTPALTAIGERIIRTSTADATNPTVAWNGSGWQTAWEDTASGDVFVDSAVVSPELGSQTGTQMLQDANSNWPVAASDGKSTVLAFYGFPDGAQIQLARLNSTGQLVGSVIEVADKNRGKYPSIAYNSQGNDFGVVWQDSASAEIVFARIACQ